MADEQPAAVGDNGEITVAVDEEAATASSPAPAPEAGPVQDTATADAEPESMTRSKPSTSASEPGVVLAGGEAEEEPDYWDEMDKAFDSGLDKYDYDLDEFRKKDQVPFLKTRDKWFFTLGVMNILTIAYAGGGHPGFLPYFYTLKFPLLISIRFFYYKTKDWHFFLIDFCYFANILLVVYMWFMPKSQELFMMLFGLTFGPLAWAVLAFRNSLVFHSLDKITSAFIHITPFTLTYLIRFNTNQMWWPHYDVCRPTESCPSPFFWLTIAPTLFFIAHNIVYWTLLTVLGGTNPKYLTAYRYLTAHKGSMFYKLVNIMGGKGKEFLFSAFYTLFAFVTMLPAYLMYTYDNVAFVFVVFMIAVSVYNGANFYVEVFSRGYGSKKKQTVQKKLSILAR